MSKIIRLESTNYKRLKAVEIAPDPDGNLVIVAGKNGQGKTSILDSITAALGGVNAKTTPKPIRDGEERAEIVLETEELIVTRKFTASGSTLTVKSHDGAVYSKGQAKLDDLLGKLSLDPLAFTQLSDRDQLATLLGLVDLPFDPTALDAERAGIFRERTDVGSKGKAIGDAKVDASLPANETSVSDLLGQYQSGQKQNARLDSALDAMESASENVADLERRLVAAKASLKVAAEALKASPDRVELEVIQDLIDGAETTNAGIRANNAARAQAKAQYDLRAEYKALTGKLEAIDKRKAEGLAAATFPVDGLGFDEGGVTYQGVPFKQASSAEQLRVSLAMAIALNPALRVIRIADGSLLDSDNLALIESMAKAHDFQVWIEIVGDGDGRGIIIEDGSVLNTITEESN
ncbi:MAG: ATP-binding protein [Actinomycetota bacterium]|nr:ATP-binding protein [Actinomycetota bacterium]